MMTRTSSESRNSNLALRELYWRDKLIELLHKARVGNGNYDLPIVPSESMANPGWHKYAH